MFGHFLEWWQRWRTLIVGVALCSAAFTLYARTAAPSVMAGDSAEFQFAAPLGGIPHPTGYPLYMLLGKLATLGAPSDIAHRVTLLSSLLAALTVALLALLMLRLAQRLLPALITGVALMAAPGLWNAATIAEVYALNALLLVLLAWSLLFANSAGPHQKRWQLAAACVTGLGFSHHGSFAFIGAPLFLGSGVYWLWCIFHTEQLNKRSQLLQATKLVGGCFLAGVCGLAPWIYPFVQYARYGPFVGLDHGLPRHYFWGSPTSWGDVANHLVGGVMRGGVFRLPDLPTALEAAHTLVRRLRFEFGTWGCLLGVVGCVALFWRNRAIWLGSVWVAGMTALYFALLGQAVQDSLVFTLPLLLPWVLWMGSAALMVYDVRLPVGTLHTQTNLHIVQGLSATKLYQPALFARHLVVLCLLLVTCAWGYSRLPYGNKADQWLFRSFGEGVLMRLDPDAVVLVRWEQGTTLQYLRLAEGQRPDVTIDIVEPEDVPWTTRAALRYEGRPVYMIGSDADAARWGGRFIWGTDYARLFRLAASR